MLAEKRAGRREEYDGAVERAAIALDDADDEVLTVSGGNLAKPGALGARQVDGGIVVAPKGLAAVRRSRTDHGAEVAAARIAADQRLREQHQARAGGSGLCGECSDLVDRGRGVSRRRDLRNGNREGRRHVRCYCVRASNFPACAFTSAVAWSSRSQ